MSLGGSPTSPTSRKRHTYATFDGQMQQLIINSRSYFELIANGDFNTSSSLASPVSVLNRTVTFSRPDIPHKYPLTFRTFSAPASSSSLTSPHQQPTWLALPKIDTLHLLMIQFHFKTSVANGLIMYNRGIQDDFIVVELIDGQVVFSFGLNRVRIFISS